MIKRDEIGLPIEDLPRSACPTSFNGKNFKHLENVVANYTGVSQRKRRKQFDVTQSTIHSNLKKVDLKDYKCQKAPKYNESHFEQVAKKCRKMRRRIAISNIFLIVDDEKYLTFSNDEMLQNIGFYVLIKTMFQIR